MRARIHEMRNQLAVAVANIEAFVDGKLAPTTGRMNAVLQALYEIDVLIDDLRERAPAPALPPTEPAFELIDVCELLHTETVAFEAAAQAAGVTLDVGRCEPTTAACATIWCDPGQISQVVKNLLLNAIKYTGSGGRVTVDCRRAGNGFALKICDDGPGVPDDERALVFETGVRGSTARSLPGSGVGLSVARNIARQHGGTIDVDRSALGGARFTLGLPDAHASVPLACRACTQDASFTMRSPAAT